MTVIEVKENGAIRTKMLSCDSPFIIEKIEIFLFDLLTF